MLIFNIFTNHHLEFHMLIGLISVFLFINEVDFIIQKFLFLHSFQEQFFFLSIECMNFKSMEYNTKFSVLVMHNFDFLVCGSHIRITIVQGFNFLILIILMIMNLIIILHQIRIFCKYF